MEIRCLFDDLKKLGRKKYYFRNGDEEIYFLNKKKSLEIEIANTNNNIDLIINHNGCRANYRVSESLSDSCKKDIELILNSHISADIKYKKIRF